VTKLRRGFKAEAERISACVRRDLELEEWDPICPWELAKLLEFNVVDLSEFEDRLPDQVAMMRSCTGPKGFSALTLFPDGDNPLIILNDGHGLPRQAADLAHELAHGLLLHSPENFGHGGRGKVDKICEAEASWLGPTLLVPGEAALRIARQETGLRTAARSYRVSEKLMEMRLQVTGARRRARS
jgi:Zn-dependent peptidase ImmA (M78 family)